MRRRSRASSKPAKGRSREAQTPKPRDAPTVRRRSSAADQELEVVRLSRERNEAREQQIATAEILRVIRASPNDVQPVYVRTAVSLCGGLFANVFRFDGEQLHYVASHNVGPSYADLLSTKYPMRPDSSQVSGRAVRTKSVFGWRTRLPIRITINDFR
jgi:hypothetical protein